jgi:hypothetical protein
LSQKFAQLYRRLVRCVRINSGDTLRGKPAVHVLQQTAHQMKDGGVVWFLSRKVPSPMFGIGNGQEDFSWRIAQWPR